MSSQVPLLFFHFVSNYKKKKGSIMITVKDVVVGTKVKLNGKHYPYEKTYDNIDDWFNDNEWSPSCMEIKENGFAYIANEVIVDNMFIYVSNKAENGAWWYFSLSDVDLYIE